MGSSNKKGNNIGFGQQPYSGPITADYNEGAVNQNPNTPAYSQPFMNSQQPNQQPIDFWRVSVLYSVTSTAISISSLPAAKSRVWWWAKF